MLSRELSRLSRTDKDWCHLLELCQVFNTLIADAENLYDLNRMDDQLVLGILCGTPHKHAICSAARYVVQPAQVTVNASFFLTQPDIIFVLQIAFSCSSRPTVAFHRGSSLASPGQVDFIASSLALRSTSA